MGRLLRPGGVLVVLAVILAVGQFYTIAQSYAAAGINGQISFTGKVVSKTDGTNTANGTYNMEFKIYSGGTSTGGGTLVWTEDWLVSASNGIAVSGGTFQNNLGSISSLSTVDFNSDTLWLSMQVGGTASCTPAGNFQANCSGDGEMSPYIRLTAVPYALNAGKIGGFSASQLAQLSPSAQQTGSINVSGTIQSAANLVMQGTAASTFVGDLSVTRSTNAVVQMSVTNTSTGTGAVANFQANNSLGGAIFGVGGSAYSTFPLAQNRAFVLAGTGLSGMTLLNQTAQPIIFGISNAEVARFDSTGNFQLQNVNGLTLGTTSNKGGIVFQDGTANNYKLTLATPPLVNNYQLTWATTGATGNQCLQSTSGSTGTVTAMQWGACGSGGSGGTLQTAYTAGNTITQTAGNGINITTGTAVPTTNMFSLDNTGSTGTVNNNVNGLNINYKGGAAAVEAAGMRIDFTPGTTSGGTWSGLRIAAGATGAASGVTEYGIKLEGPTTPGLGNETALYVGTGWDIGLDLHSGGIQLSAQNDPAATPAAGSLQIYAKTIGGRTMPKWIGPAGVDTPFQASFGFNRISMMAPTGLPTAAATTVMQAWGANYTNSASTYTNPALASTNLLSSTRRARLQTTTSANALAYHIPTSLMAWRGNAANRGGFYFTMRFGFGSLSTTGKAFIGMTDSVANPTAIDPTAAASTTPGKLGLAITGNTGNLKWVNNLSGTAPTVVDLGATMPVNTTDLYELIIFSPPNGSNITYRVKNLSTEAVTADTVVSTNIPANTTFLAPQYYTYSSGTTANAIDNAGWYLESDN